MPADAGAKRMRPDEQRLRVGVAVVAAQDRTADLVLTLDADSGASPAFPSTKPTSERAKGNLPRTDCEE